MEPSLLVKTITKLIKEKKGYDISIIDIKKLSSLTDYFIICTSDSDPQTRAISNLSFIISEQSLPNRTS